MKLRCGEFQATQGLWRYLKKNLNKSCKKIKTSQLKFKPSQGAARSSAFSARLHRYAYCDVFKNLFLYLAGVTAFMFMGMLTHPEDSSSPRLL